MRLIPIFSFLSLLLISACFRTDDFDNSDDLAFLEENAAREDVTVTGSGLQYRVLEEGDGDTPDETSVVRVHYTGKLINDIIFDSSHLRGTPADFPVNAVIQGFSEGLLLMREGDIFELVLPAELAYGDFPPAGSSIYPGATLIFEVELLQILE